MRYFNSRAVGSGFVIRHLASLPSRIASIVAVTLVSFFINSDLSCLFKEFTTPGRFTATTKKEICKKSFQLRISDADLLGSCFMFVLSNKKKIVVNNSVNRMTWFCVSSSPSTST